MSDELPQLHRALHIIETFKQVFGGKPPEMVMTTEQHEAYKVELTKLPEKFMIIAKADTIVGVPIRIVDQ